MLSKLRYIFRDEYETRWMFQFEKVGDLEGWFVFKQNPGDPKFFCKGTATEGEVEKVIIAQPKPLTDDDLIDLQVWMKDTRLDQPKEDFKIIGRNYEKTQDKPNETT